MLKPLWLLTRTIALSVIVDVSVVAAQTVIVRSTPPNGTVEVQVDGGAVRSATADANGDVTVPVAVPGGAAETAVQVFVDRCDPIVRVQLVRRGVPLPAPGAGCRRGDIWGAFHMGAVTTFVVDTDTPGSTVHVRQGPPPREWIARGDQPAERGRFQSAPPSGFMVWAGAGLARDPKAIDNACGTAAGCSGDRLSGAIGAGATYWFNRFVGAQVSIAKRAQANAAATADTYRFDSTVDTRLTTLAGLAGVSAGPVRLYAQGGANRHRATFSTTQTTNDVSVTVDNVPQTIKGGTQTLQFTTEGWGWMVGGGVEAWATRWVALYADGQYAKLRGADVTGGEGRVDETLLLLTAGVRVRIGR